MNRKIKKYFYQCIDCKKYHKSRYKDAERCPECTSIYNKKISCVRHGGTAKTSKDCNTCVMEARMGGVLRYLNKLMK